MSSIPLKMSTVHSFLGSSGYNGCQGISKIHVRSNQNGTASIVEARIPASTTNQRDYAIKVNISQDGKQILGASCTCPIGNKCKHIYKVLCRVVLSSSNDDDDDALIPSPSRYTQEQVRRRENQTVQFTRGAYVYVAMSCRSELDSGSDYRYSGNLKDNFDQEVLGIFFSVKKANRCAKDYLIEELGHDVDEDTDEEESDDMMTTTTTTRIALFGMGRIMANLMALRLTKFGWNVVRLKTRPRISTNNLW